MNATLLALADGLRADGGLLAGATVDPAPGAAAPLGERAASGRATGTRAADYALLVEAIHEGYLAHYGQGRVLRSPDPDLELLAGDHLYAQGLERLADLGDLEAVEILAGVIASCAQAHAEGRPQDAAEAWRTGAEAVARRGAPRSEPGPIE
jgi:hypothetical protein